MTTARVRPAIPRLLRYDAGCPDPLGARVQAGGVNFSLVAPSARAVSLCVFEPGGDRPRATIPLAPREHRTADRWHVLVHGIGAGVEYLWHVESVSGPASSREGGVHVLDPYARRLSGAEVWGDRTRRDRAETVLGYRCVVEHEAPRANTAHRPTRPLTDDVIYEMHVRGFTQHASSGVTHRGTYAGAREKLPYLRDLGVTAIELLPVQEFDETENARVNPLTGAPLLNYWGYSPVVFSAPKAAYASASAHDAASELRAFVDAAHELGLRIILDVVFNHTAEGGADGDTYAFRGIDDALYYLHDPVTGAYRDVTGCGNTVAAHEPVVRALIVDALSWWVEAIGVDGFRFDLASALTRDVDGEPIAGPVPLIDDIAAAPALRDAVLIAEPWDAAGLYHVGAFPGGARWSEWNGRFRDVTRRFVRGEPGLAREMALRLAGSPDLYAARGRPPSASINFVTCHDGFTLADAVTYEHARNDANGEHGCDGSRDNHTWNCGVDGPSDDPAVRALRARQVRNLLALTCLAHGVPMLLAGDEMGRTQRGNNNAYCHDDDVSWIDWSLAEANADLVRFVRGLLALRRREPLLRPSVFPDASAACTHRVAYHGPRLYVPSWETESRWFAVHQWTAGEAGHHAYIMANASWDGREFELPPLDAAEWVRALDTSLPSPHDIAEAGAEETLENADRYAVSARSVVMLVARVR